jgi:predicted Zn-dependent protease
VGRITRVLIVAVVGLWALGPSSRADDKKNKPGLFDFGGWKSPVTRQRDAAKQLVPGTFDLVPAFPHAEAARPVRLRVYADRDYRQAVLRWQNKLRAQIDRINRVVRPVFGVTFEIESMRDWNASHVGAPLDAALGELETLDPAQDVDWVLGLITPFRGVTMSIHQLGMTRLLARHILLRGMDDEQEGQALNNNFDLLDSNERGTIYGERKAHKEIVVFLHEWAHTMGALHDEDRTIVMNPLYDPKQAAFSEFEQRLIMLVLERRLTRPSEAFPESAGHELETLLASAPAEEGSSKDRAVLLDIAHQHAGGRSATGAPAPNALPAADSEAYNRVVDALNAGRADDAWNGLQPLIARHPRQAAIATLACHLVAAQPHADEARAACDAAAALDAQDARPLLEAAAAYARAGDLARATPLVLAGAARATAAPADIQRDLRVAELAGAVGALSAGEQALARVGRGQGEQAARIVKLSGELDAARRRLALPRDATRWGVPPEKEPAFAAAFWETSDRLSSGDGAAGRARLRELSAAYPEAPGTDLLSCEAELRARHAAAASKRCETALSKYDEATRAHYLLGFIAVETRHDAAAEKHLRRAILLDPGESGAWQELARFYKATRANQRLSELRAEHQALLSSPLPE